MKTYHVDFFVNGEEYELDVPANKTALNIIRDMLDLTGAKEGCGAGECGGASGDLAAGRGGRTGLSGW